MLSEAILSVQQYVKVSYEIIVVDNASNDGTQSSLPLAFPQVKLIANTTNKGFSAANNQGFAKSSGQYILLLNPDAALINGQYELALAFLNKHPDTLIGPKLLNPDLSVQESVLLIPGWLDVLKEAFFVSYLFTSDWEKRADTANFALSGACLLMARGTYEVLHGLDEDLFWMDDVDFCFRARKNGINPVYFKEWTVTHVIGQSGKKNLKLSISNQLISKLKFFKKQEQILNYGLSAFAIQMHMVLRLFLFLILSPFGAVYRSKFSAYAYSQTLFFKYIFTGKKQTF